MANQREYPEPIWVPQGDLRLGDVSGSRYGDAVLVRMENDEPHQKLWWRTDGGETFTTVVRANERDHVTALIRRGES